MVGLFNITGIQNLHTNLVTRNIFILWGITVR